MTATAWLAGLGRADAPSVGSKAANLGELMRVGFPVPPGFAVGTAAYIEAMQEGGVSDELRALLAEANTLVDVDPAAFTAAAERLRALVRKAGMSPALKEEVLAAYHRLGNRVPVAVRSSAPGEDTTTMSFAGMHDTYANVVGEDALLDRTVDCWVSLYGDRVMAYRASHFLRDEPVLAVIVQELLEAEAAGVMFTADPSSRDPDRIMIEAGFGLGEAVMGGEVEPDNYVVAKRAPRLVQVCVGYKTHKAVAGPGGTVDRVDLSLDDSRRRVLSDEQAIALAQLGTEVEARFRGTPQDVEWAIAGDSPYIVQTRPITAWGEPPGIGPFVSGVELVRGLAAAPGTVTGHVRILMSPEHWRRVNPGDVLVAPMTNPEWLPAIRRSAALVTDGGGITCHGAIVARELGVPCVVATRTGTTRLRDGEVVTVDGAAGAVLAGIAGR